MEKKRCFWVGSTSLYKNYHDLEWGVPTYDDDTLFEFLLLETFQAGLSWITILKKRENFKKAFNGFNYKKIADYSEKKYEELIKNEGIIRNKLKIRAAITNAQAFIRIQEEFGSFSKYIWSFTDNKPILNKFDKPTAVPASTKLSETVSKALKKRGFTFVGSTIIYAYMQAIGMVNDHTTDCFRYKEIAYGNLI